MVIPTLLACVLVTPQPPKPNWELATIKSVICSNVVIVAVDKDPDLWVNLLGVGTPETVDPLKDKFLIGAPDPNWLRSWLPRGTRVWMERRGVTASGRPLVFLYRVGDLFCYNSFLVRSGGAFAARQADYPEFDEFAGLERAARERGDGLWRGYPADNLGTGNPVAAARDRGPSTQVHTTAPSVGETVGARTTHKKRRSYVRQDWARFDAALGGVLNRALYGGMGPAPAGAPFGVSHLCGAPTLDGTPCMRLVLNGIHCYQHGG